jgi:hypothetical protein
MITLTKFFTAGMQQDASYDNIGSVRLTQGHVHEKCKSEPKIMFSIVCVFNDERVLNERLLSSVATQTEAHEVISVNNVAGRFDQAATALNWGAEQARGNWLLFAHQDVAFLSSDWLARAKHFLESESAEGWYGVAGLTMSGKLRGFMLDRTMLLGGPFAEKIQVQTLDECLLIHRHQPDGVKYFDEAVPGWHAYGVEACCAAIQSGAANYVLPLPIWHDSKSTNLQGLEEAHRYIWDKHGSALGRIATTCGNLPDTYGWRKPHHAAFGKLCNRIHNSYDYWLAGYPGTATEDFEEKLEYLTESENVVECLHTTSWHTPIKAKGFVRFPRRSRQILHRFSGRDFDDLNSDCIVVATDLSERRDGNFDWLRDLSRRVRRVILCVEWQRDASFRKALNALMQDAQTAQWTKHWDGTARAILEL